MLRYAANLTMLFNEVPFLERFARAAAAGFRAVEFLFIHDVDRAAVARELQRHRLELVLFDPEGGRRLNVLAGNRAESASDDLMRRTMVETLAAAAPMASTAGITLLIEVLNTWESPRYFLDRSRLALGIVREVGAPNVRFQFDCYHLQRMEGQLIDGLITNLQWIGHVQIADVPGRHEPGTGEIHYGNVLAALERAGYDGYVGLEYRPSGKTEDSLAWLPREARGRR